jgi:drug/metabolite transporter (DMT)-like permease
LLLGVIAVSTASIFITRALDAGAPDLTVAAYRLTIAALVLAPLAWTGGRAELAALTRRDLALALVAGACLGLHFITWIASLALTSIVSSVVLVTASPLLVALASPLVLRESLRPPALAGVCLAVAGGAIIGWSDGGQRPATLTGDALALTGAVMAAGYFLAGRRLRVKLALIPYIFIVYGVAALLVDALVLALRIPLTGFAPEAYLWLVLLALVPQLIGHSSFNWALRHAPAALATVPVLGEPVGATVLAFVFLGQRPGPLTLAGGALVLVGVFVVTAYGMPVAPPQVVASRPGPLETRKPPEGRGAGPQGDDAS